MRKFKHRVTDVIGVLEEGWLNYTMRSGNMASDESIPEMFMEDSLDWIEITEPEYLIKKVKVSPAKGHAHVHYTADSQLKDVFCLVDGKAPFIPLDQILACFSQEIHAVQRVEDMEIFSKGDEIKYEDKYLPIVKIEEYAKEPKGMYVWVAPSKSVSFGIKLSNAVKKPKPLYEILTVTIDPINSCNNRIKKVRCVETQEEYEIGNVFRNQSNIIASIKEFEEMGNGNIRIKFSSNSGVTIVGMHRYERPLFKTEDGRYIFQGMSWHYVKLSNFDIKTTCVFQYKGLSSNKSEVVRFHSIELAHEYVKKRAKTLSFVDVAEMLRDSQVGGTPKRRMYELLKEKVKIK
jgi:hypothetical protein